MWQVREAKADSRQGQEQAMDLALCTLQGAEMKQTQYERILAALRKAGNKGCTNHDLMLYSNCPWRRLSEMFSSYIQPIYGPYVVNGREAVEFGSRVVNGRTVRVYRLVKV